MFEIRKFFANSPIPVTQLLNPVCVCMSMIIFALILMKICCRLKDEGRKRGGEEELTERGSGADGGLSSQIDST